MPGTLLVRLYDFGAFVAPGPEFWQKQGMFWRRGANMIEQRIDREIRLVMTEMIGAAEDRREYLIGMLTALVWVRFAGEVMCSVAFEQACAAWERARRAIR